MEFLQGLVHACCLSQIGVHVPLTFAAHGAPCQYCLPSIYILNVVNRIRMLMNPKNNVSSFFLALHDLFEIHLNRYQCFSFTDGSEFRIT